jgi:5,6-dimethylbenzimidazole synthase
MMQFEEFIELIHKRRSIRRFKSDPVPDEYVTKILEAARWGMSGANAQPWEFVIVKNQETRYKIIDAIREQRKIEYRMELTRVEELRHPGLASIEVSIPTYYEAPVIIAVCGDRRTLYASVEFQNFDLGEGGPWGAYIKGMATATFSIHLAAAALGLGSAWISVSHVVEGVIKAALGVPEPLEIHTLIPLGYAAYNPLPTYRRNLSEIVHYEKYDLSRFRSLDDILKYITELRNKGRPVYKKAVPS